VCSVSMRLALILAVATANSTKGGDVVIYEGGQGPGAGQHVVLISGDEEYRSEEALPQLGKILATHHGFHCTVLFAMDDVRSIIHPNVINNIPGLDALTDADLMIIFTRLRALPADQMRFIDDYLRSGRPVIGLRTATHAFNFPADDGWAHYGNGYEGSEKAWTDGFGRLVLGEKWIRHHGQHKHQSTRGVIASASNDHPIVRGLEHSQVWGPTDVYGVRLPLPGDSQPIVLGEVVNRAGVFDEDDPFYGMKPTDRVPDAELNSPMMPIAWTKTYKIPNGEPGRAFCSTLGASTDLVAEGTRRLIVNAVYWCLAMEDRIPASGSNVPIVGPYRPTAYQFRENEYWEQRKMRVAEHQLEAK